jgi:hypothetical protein
LQLPHQKESRPGIARLIGMNDKRGGFDELGTGDPSSIFNTISIPFDKILTTTKGPRMLEDTFNIVPFFSVNNFRRGAKVVGRGRMKRVVKNSGAEKGNMESVMKVPIRRQGQLEDDVGDFLDNGKRTSAENIEFLRRTASFKVLSTEPDFVTDVELWREAPMRVSILLHEGSRFRESDRSGLASREKMVMEIGGCRNILKGRRRMTRDTRMEAIKEEERGEICRRVNPVVIGKLSGGEPIGPVVLDKSGPETKIGLKITVDTFSLAISLGMISSRK